MSNEKRPEQLSAEECAAWVEKARHYVSAGFAMTMERALVEVLDEAERERDDLLAIVHTVVRERDEARAQLAGTACGGGARTDDTSAGPRRSPSLKEGRDSRACADDISAVLAEFDRLVLAAAEHDARVRAPVEAERDALALALTEVMTPRGIYDAWSLNRVLRRLADAADHLLNDHSCDRHGYEGVVCARDAARDHADAIEKLALHADLAAQREARIRADERAKVLREAGDLAQERALAYEGAAIRAVDECEDPSWSRGRAFAARQIEEGLRALAAKAEETR